MTTVPASELPETISSSWLHISCFLFKSLSFIPVLSFSFFSRQKWNTRDEFSFFKKYFRKVYYNITFYCHRLTTYQESSREKPEGFSFRYNWPLQLDKHFMFRVVVEQPEVRATLFLTIQSLHAVYHIVLICFYLRHAYIS